MGIEQHLAAVIGTTSTLRRLVPYDPLSAEELMSLVEDPGIENMSASALKRMWITPISRILQNHFGIDQRAYGTSTNPTLSELEEDFKIAVAITFEKFFKNQHELIGLEQAAGSTRIWTNAIPQRASALLARHGTHGSKVERG